MTLAGDTLAGDIMRKILTALTAAAAIAAVATPVSADGARRAWRGPAYAVGAISRNVITPFYVGYYGSHYSYYAPGPYPNYMTVPGCWRRNYGYSIWVC